MTTGKKVRCFQCNEHGHIKRDSPKLNPSNRKVKEKVSEQEEYRCDRPLLLAEKDFSDNASELQRYTMEV